jgi:glucose-1-phosphate thymidylyltransferase
MKVILLCAGYALRLYPLTRDVPKSLLPIAERPILDYLLESLKNLPDVEGIFLVTNHKFARLFQDWITEQGYERRVDVLDDQTTSNEKRRGAIGDLAFVLGSKKIKEDDLLVLAGDNLFDFDLPSFILAAKEKQPHAVVAVYDVKDTNLAKQYGIVRVDVTGKVVEFLEKPKKPPSTLASCGIYWLPAETRVLLDRYLAEGHNSDQPGHYMRWLAQVHGLFAVTLKGHWYDIGDPASYEKANAEMQKIQKKSKERL